MTSLLFVWELCVTQLGTFYHHQDYEQVGFYKTSSSNIVGWSLQDGQVTSKLQEAQNWNLSTKN